MTHRTLIVAHLKSPDALTGIADAFAKSDATPLPAMVGVQRRTLLHFHDLYFHLVESEDDISANLNRARSHPLYVDVNAELSQYVNPYDPNWREPKDAMARPFYVYTPQGGVER